jgi:hypothetical protein
MNRYNETQKMILRGVRIYLVLAAAYSVMSYQQLLVKEHEQDMIFIYSQVQHHLV